MFKNVTIFHDFLLKQNGVKYFVPLIRVLNCKTNVGGPFKLVFQVSFRWSDSLKYFTIFCKTKMVPDKFCPTNSCLNFKTDLGETIKPIFETFLEWSTILKYFMIFLKIKIVADFLLSLKFVLNGIQVSFLSKHLLNIFFWFWSDDFQNFQIYETLLSSPQCLHHQ